jgi:hypothetical protein
LYRLAFGIWYRAASVCQLDFRRILYDNFKLVVLVWARPWGKVGFNPMVFASFAFAGPKLVDRQKVSRRDGDLAWLIMLGECCKPVNLSCSRLRNRFGGHVSDTTKFSGCHRPKVTEFLVDKS